MKIYSQTNCSHCDKLKNKLNKLNIPFTDVDINVEANKEECEKLGFIYRGIGKPR